MGESSLHTSVAVEKLNEAPPLEQRLPLGWAVASASVSGLFEFQSLAERLFECAEAELEAVQAVVDVALAGTPTTDVGESAGRDGPRAMATALADAEEERPCGAARRDSAYSRRAALRSGSSISLSTCCSASSASSTGYDALRHADTRDSDTLAHHS